MKTIKFNSLFHLCTKRHFSTNKITNESIRLKKNELFIKEKARQLSLITRIEKMEVNYRGVPADCSLVMNKRVSTPYNCAMHIHEMLCQRSVVAEADGQLWDMHRPLAADSCELRFWNFHTNPAALNKIFWRSCSFLLGLVLDRAFKDEHFVDLHSWPKPSVKSGSYVYDADIGIANWTPTDEELRTLTAMLCKLASEDNKFERLDVPLSVAIEMFEHNRFKRQQIPRLATDGSVTLYRVKDHVDVSCGPMIASTKFVGTTRFASVHRLDDDCAYRFQAVSIPKQLTLNSFAFGVLVDRAKKLNVTGLEKDVDAPRAEESVSVS